MSTDQHEEFEVGHHLEQATRHALLGLSQVVERMARSSAERDRAEAQRLRADLLNPQSPPSHPSGEPGGVDAGLGGRNQSPQTDQIDQRDRTDQRDQRSAQRYLDTAAAVRPDASDQDLVVTAWAAAARDAAADPQDLSAAAAARQLRAYGVGRYGVDPVQELAAAADDLAARQADRSGTATAADLADTEEQAIARATLGIELATETLGTLESDSSRGGEVGDRHLQTGTTERTQRDPEVHERAEPVVVPADAANQDRGVSPSKALTEPEAEHRRQAWSLARAGWEAEQLATGAGTTSTAQGQAALDAGWRGLPMETKTSRYWEQYDTVQARTIAASPDARPGPGRGLEPAATAGGVEGPQVAPAARPRELPAAATLEPGAGSSRGMSPNRAPNAAEAAHRSAAWRVAEERFTSDLPGGTPTGQARRAWRDLDWPDKAVRYWAAYDAPSTSPATSAATLPAAETSVGRPNPTPELSPAREPGAAVAAEVPRERVLALNEQAAAYWAGQATPGSTGHTYLVERVGADVVDAGTYQLGYAPPGWTNLTDHLRRGGATDTEILGADLGRRSSRGNIIDAFRDRAMVGIRDEHGATVGFTGRDLSGNPNAPKYVNTATTTAYTKGEHLFGLHEGLTQSPAPDHGQDRPQPAQPAQLDRPVRLVRVEGPFDAIAVTAAGQADRTNRTTGPAGAGEPRPIGVAPLGTALTPAQADLLAAHAGGAGGQVWQALDGDGPAAKAAEQDYWMLRERGIEARSLPLPAGSDPAQLWHEQPDRLAALLDVADAAPSAALVVAENTIVTLRPALAAGNPAATEEVAALQDQLAAPLNPGDRAILDTHVTGLLQDLRPITPVSAVDDAADNTKVPPVGAAAERPAAPPAAAKHAAVGNVDKRRVAAGINSPTSATTPPPPAATSSSAGEPSTLERTAAPEGPRPPSSDATVVPEVYDRASTIAPSMAQAEPEAAAARRVAAAGFSRPTSQMLADAGRGLGIGAAPTTTTAKPLGRSRTVRP